MKPFNLEAAKAGWPVCTRDGRPARLLATDRYNAEDILPLVALVRAHSNYEEDVRLHQPDGRFLLTDTETGNDLMMATKVNVMWINVFRAEDGRSWTGSYDSEDEALFGKANSPLSYHAGPFKLEWEEEFDETV